MKKAFDRLFSRQDIAEERISEVGDMSIETSKTQNQRKRKTERNRTEYPRTVG